MPKRDVVLATLMSSKKTVFLLPTGLALVLCTIALVGSISPAVYGQQQGTTGGQQQGTTGGQQQGTTGGQTGSTIDCQTAASTLGGMVIPNPTGTCDVAVPRQGLQVQDSATGASLNNLLVINPLFEFTQIQSQAGGGAQQQGGGTTGGNQTMVYGFAEFALMEGELTSAMRMLSNTSWNVVAVHNHVTGESPSMIFAHAIANGDINTLTRDARMVLDGLMTQMQTQQGNQTATTGGGAQQQGGGTTGGDINSSPSANSLTGGTTTGQGATAGGGVGTMGGGGGTSPDPGIGTTDGAGGGGQQQQQQQGGGETGATTTNGTGGGGEASGGVTAIPGGAAGPQVSP